IGVGMTLAVAPLTTVVMDSVAASETGIASGVNNTAARVAGVIAIASLTAIAIWRFGGALVSHLQAAGVPSPLVAELSGGASQLAELPPPHGTPEPVAAAVSAAVATAYVATFRLLTFLCSALAVASAVIAWFSMATASEDR